jgi:adenosine deaminase
VLYGCHMVKTKRNLARAPQAQPVQLRWLQAFSRRIAAAAGILVALVAIGLASLAFSDARVTDAMFSGLRDDPTALRAFLQRMPKGGDLHVHLSGAAYAERLIAFAEQDGLCVRMRDMALLNPPCLEGSQSVAAAVGDQALYDKVIDALSMRGTSLSGAASSGHDRFFATFDRFGPATGRRFVDLTVELLRHYADESVQYTELMTSFFSRADRERLAAAIGGQADDAAKLAVLKENGLDEIVAAVRRRLADDVARIDAALACDRDRSHAGCDVRYRYISQVTRSAAPDDVFVQIALSVALIRAEPRVVALNLVQPEDGRVARADYAAQMRMIGTLAADVPVALHAGELWIGLVPPSDLTFHIRDAVTIAGARRIGHGVSLAFEKRMDELLAEMRRRQVAVEINLTSNDVILGVRGKSHPLPTYMKAGVPVVLSTDDAGISRIDLTNEYVRAAREYGLRYRDLKAIARNALLHAFLSEREKQDELARFDELIIGFEREVAGQGFLSRVGTLLTALIP